MEFENCGLGLGFCRWKERKRSAEKLLHEVTDHVEWEDNFLYDLFCLVEINLFFPMFPIWWLRKFKRRLFFTVLGPNFLYLYGYRDSFALGEISSGYFI